MVELIKIMHTIFERIGPKKGIEKIQSSLNNVLEDIKIDPYSVFLSKITEIECIYKIEINNSFFTSLDRSKTPIKQLIIMVAQKIADTSSPTKLSNFIQMGSNRQIISKYISLIEKMDPEKFKTDKKIIENYNKLWQK